eukprot:1480375-Rhodomonas_salina.1
MRLSSSARSCIPRDVSIKSGGNALPTYKQRKRSHISRGSRKRGCRDISRQSAGMQAKQVQSYEQRLWHQIDHPSAINHLS